MKIFLIGDHYSGTGPAIVTAKYIENIPGVVYQKTRNRILRVVELIFKIMRSDVLLLSGHSKQNILSLKFAHLLGKKGAYLMHGCVEHEDAINGVSSEDMNKTERVTMELCDAIYAVSNSFSDFLKDRYPNYKDKIFVAQNGIDAPEISNKSTNRKPYQLISIGGGMPRKMIKFVASAVTILRKEEEYEDLRLVVVGDVGLDTPEINSYDCVSNLGLVDHDTCLRLLDQSTLFIQNSCFETFGLAPLEALCRGTSVLMSKHVGAIELFNDVTSSDIIEAYSNPSEIADKIKGLLISGNNERLLNSLELEKYTWAVRSEQLVKMLSKLAESAFLP